MFYVCTEHLLGAICMRRYPVLYLAQEFPRVYHPMHCNTKGIVPGDTAYCAVGYGDWIRSERRIAGPVHTESTHLLLSTLPELKYNIK
jgi:hypothetical protein